LPRGINRKGFQLSHEAVNLIEYDSLAAVGHQQAVANFIGPQEGNLGAPFGEACKDGQAVFSIRFVFQKPLERKRSVQHEITQ
jgi:hypothetical protein